MLSQPRTFVLVALVAVGLLSAGFAGSRGASEKTEVARFLEAVDPIAVYEAGTAFVAPRVVSCMESQGYEGFVYRPSTRGDLSAVDPTDELVGFGVSLFAFEDHQLVVEYWSLPPKDREQWSADRQPGFDRDWNGERYMRAEADARKCEDVTIRGFVAMRSETANPDLIDRFQRAVAAERRRDPAIAARTKEWSECMAEQDHDYRDPAELGATLRRKFDLNRIYAIGADFPEEERLQQQMDAIIQFRNREIALGHASDECSTELWEATIAMRERVAHNILSSA